MGICQCQPKGKVLKKNWLTSSQKQFIRKKSIEEMQFQHTLQSYPTMHSVESTKDELEDTSDSLFRRFDKNKDGILDRTELIEFIKYAHRRCGQKNKTNSEVLNQLRVLFAKAGVNMNQRDYIKREEFIGYIQHLFQNQVIK